MAPYRRPPRQLSQRNYRIVEEIRARHAQITAGDRPLPRGEYTAAPVNYVGRPLKISEYGRFAIDKLAEAAEARHPHFDKTG